MRVITPEDAGHVINMILRDNRGGIITDALAVGIEQAVIFYCSSIAVEAEPKTEPPNA